MKKLSLIILTLFTLSACGTEEADVNELDDLDAMIEAELEDLDAMIDEELGDLDAMIDEELGDLELGEDWNLDLPEGVTIEKDFPAEVKEGDEFTFSVNIKNDSSESHELTVIDLGEPFLEGVELLDISESTTDEYNLLGARVLGFETEIPAGEEVEVTFEAKAIKKGDYSGELNVCVGDAINCLFSTAEVTVK